MDDFDFLTIEEVEILHSEQLRLHGGREGYIDRTVIESAIGMPGQSMYGQYLHEDVAAMAGAYLFHLAAMKN
jgi:death-on-curing protein